MVDTEYQYVSEFVVSVDRVFSELHVCSTRSFELHIRSVDAVFEVDEIAFESINVRFEVFDAHQGETKERLIPLRHQRKMALR
ncbi:hypothetical protein SAMN04488066_104206 [Halorubrum aquaticum]|uniref:Uncharacterized protein n=1 Tax=Halorubrum aquaticum TaxID=387340 RepID=A0A1I3A746_9EURY|nr:hypothetical protein SAMN04488066_104206 [Halorubrum aquaticum]